MASCKLPGPHRRAWRAEGSWRPASPCPSALRLRDCSRQQQCGAAAAPSPAQLCRSSQAASSSSSSGPLFDSLAELLAPGALVTSGATPLGRGLIAKAPIARGATLLAVDYFNLLAVTLDPESHGTAFSARVLGDWQALHGPMPPLLAEYLLSAGSDWFLRLVAAQLWVTQHGPPLWSQGYAQLLPAEEDMTSLMHYTQQDAQELQDAELMRAAAEERAAILRLHDTIFSSSSGDLRSLRLAPRPADTLAAAFVVNSRTFCESVAGEVCALLVPLADMANHANRPTTEFRYDPPSSTFQLRALADLPAGAEPCISYLGTSPSKDNMQLMKAYGFIIPGNPNDRLAFDAGDDVASRLAGQGPVLALTSGSFVAAMREYAPSGAGGGSGSSVITESQAVAAGRQRAVVASLQPLFQRKGGSSGGGASNAAPQPLLAAERAAVAALRAQCQEMGRCYATSIEEDQRLLSEGNCDAGPAAAALSPRQRQAVVARLERKQLLQTAADILAHYDSFLHAQSVTLLR